MDKPIASVSWKTDRKPVAYPQAVAFMERRVAAMAAGGGGELVWLLEHPPLYTAGTSAKAHDLLEARFPVYESGRGGMYTYHGPGQRIAYVMLDLRKRGMDVRCFVHKLEDWVITALREFGIEGERKDDRIGVWVSNGGREEKIAAIGVRVRKWITYHGIAVNVAPDLSHYSGIVPCGISGYGVTSLQALGVPASMEDLDRTLNAYFEPVFGTSC